MADQTPRVGATFRRRWIEPPGAVDISTLEDMLDCLRETPRVVEAWLVGSVMTPSDGSSPYETTDVALVLDPPFVLGDEVDQAESAKLVADLTKLSASIEGRRGWLFVSQELIREHAEKATLLYSRSS